MIARPRHRGFSSTGARCAVHKDCRKSEMDSLSFDFRRASTFGQKRLLPSSFSLFLAQGNLCALLLFWSRFFVR